MINLLFSESSELFWGAVAAADLVAILCLLYRGQGVERTLAWLFGVLAFPAAGAIAYFLLADPTIERTTVRRRRQKPAANPYGDETAPSGDFGAYAPVMTVALRTTGLEPSNGNLAEVLTGDEMAFARVEEHLRHARQRIWAEYYLIRRDETGHRFLDILAEKARQGVEVRLIYDALGSFRMSRPRLDAITAAGGRCVEFLPLNPLRKRWAVHLRNHRKLIVIDGQVAFTGGMNVGDEYSGRARRRGTLHFSDTHLRLEGPCVADLEEVFAEDWKFATGESPDYPDRQIVARGNARIAIVPSGPDQLRNASQLNYFAGITSARRSVWLTSPYFIPDEAILSALIGAALKGVDVRILVPARCDVLLVGPAGRSYYQQLLGVGIRVFEYLPSMLHAKTMVIDEQLALVGSANIDIRSFRLNFEVGALIDDPAVAAALHKRFAGQLRESCEVTLTEVQAWTFAKRLRHGAARLFSPFL
ncbi:MAG: cardiolipin synthase [Deltaproteobacteria bacterium]|nr:MAG: cardiolipin synthase [Deltaproteobacteria bacterium]